jgi:broad specificity polyphosphatase/5'/3'-nucleotidase SurE
MSNLIFLGGTCGNNTWRTAFIEQLLARGVSGEVLYNPVVPDWNAEAQRREDHAKANHTAMVYYLADPQDGTGISTYSIFEAQRGFYRNPDTTIIVFDTTGMSDHAMKVMTKIAKDLKHDFPHYTGHIFDSPAHAQDWIVRELEKATAVGAV